jgi:hypothetical protein
MTTVNTENRYSREASRLLNPGIDGVKQTATMVRSKKAIGHLISGSFIEMYDCRACFSLRQRNRLEIAVAAQSPCSVTLTESIANVTEMHAYAAGPCDPRNWNYSASAE